MDEPLEEKMIAVPDERYFPVQNGNFMIFRKIVTKTFSATSNSQIVDIPLGGSLVDINKCIVNISINHFWLNENGRFHAKVNGFRLSTTGTLQVDYNVYLDPGSVQRIEELEFSGIVALQ